MNKNVNAKNFIYFIIAINEKDVTLKEIMHNMKDTVPHIQYYTLLKYFRKALDNNIITYTKEGRVFHINLTLHGKSLRTNGLILLKSISK